MKKIIVFVLMIMMFGHVCNAFDKPDPTRWFFITQTDTSEYWIDARTGVFYKGSAGTVANIWILDHYKTDDTSALQNCEINFAQRMYRILSVISFDSSGNRVESNHSPTQFSRISPGSVGEDIYNAAVDLYQFKKKKEKSAIIKQ